MRRLIVLLCATSLFELHAQIDFHPFSIYYTSPDGQVVASGDLNDDGLADAVYAVAETAAGEPGFRVYVFLQGSNGLESPVAYPYPSPGACRAMAVGDVNNDGRDDIVIGRSDSVGVYVQNASGTMDAVVSMASGSIVDGLDIGDVNNDGLLDIVASHFYDPFIRVFLQTGGGGFSSTTYAHPTAGHNEVNVADVNGDGLEDVVLMPGQFSSSLYLFTQNDSGTLDSFTPVPTTFFGTLLRGSAIGDLNGDGLNDVVATLSTTGQTTPINVWFQNGGTNVLENTVQVIAPSSPDPIEVSDVDCDGIPELLVLHSGRITCFKQDVNGDYGDYTWYTVPYADSHQPQGLALADIDSDGRRDLLLATYQGFSVLRNRTMPTTLDSAQVEVTVDTTFTDTVGSSSYFVETVLDTVGQIIISTSSVYNTAYELQLDSVRTDSLTIRYGTLCGGTVSDSLRSVHVVLQQDTLSGDSVLAVVFVDTLNVGFDALSVDAYLGFHPNPTSGIVFVEAADPLQFIGKGYQVVDLRGMIVQRGVFGAAPLRIDLSGYRAGYYQLNVTLNGTRVGGRILLLE